MGPTCTRTAIALVLLALLTLCCACSKPEPPDKERPPEPQAAQVRLRQAIEQAAERAKAAGQAPALQRDAAFSRGYSLQKQ